MEDAQVITVPIRTIRGWLRGVLASTLGIPDPDVRKGISSFASCRDLSPLQRLADDLDTGEWQRRNSALLEADELDIGYRLVVGCPA